MFKRNLEIEASKGIIEAMLLYTVAIDTSLAAGKFSFGTGTLVQINKKFFALTCKHVVEKNYKDKDIIFFYKSDTATGWGTKNDIKYTPLSILNERVAKTYGQTPPIVNRYYSSDIEDIVLLECDPNAEQIKNCQFFDLNTDTIKSPATDMYVCLVCFSSELKRKVAKDGFGIFHYSLGTKITNKKINSGGFAAKKHFLIDYTKSDDSVDPYGFSGCGVWTREPSGNNIWTPNLRFVGVQTSFYAKSQVLQATKTNSIFKLLKI